MMPFFRDMAVNPFLLTGLLAGLAASVACGVIGPYVITRRIVFLSGAIAHVAVGGIGAAIYLAATFPDTLGWLDPLHGAAIVALLSAVIIGLVHHHASERVDTLIGAMWAVGMSVGILLMKFVPEDTSSEFMGYLFGNIVLVSWSDLWLIVALDLVIVGAALLLHKRLAALCIDEEQAELQGISVMWTNIILLVLVAMAVICLIRVVGLILVLALLTLPAATAGRHVTRLGAMIVEAIILCAAVTTLPRIAVYGSPVSPEPAIVLAAAAVYLATLGLPRPRRAGTP